MEMEGWLTRRRIVGGNDKAVPLCNQHLGCRCPTLGKKDIIIALCYYLFEELSM